MPGDGAAARERLRAARGFVFDLDGTLVLTDRANRSYAPLPGALPLTRWLTSRGVPFVLLTNGTAKTPQAYARALARGRDMMRSRTSGSTGPAGRPNVPSTYRMTWSGTVA